MQFSLRGSAAPVGAPRSVNLLSSRFQRVVKVSADGNGPRTTREYREDDNSMIVPGEASTSKKSEGGPLYADEAAAAVSERPRLAVASRNHGFCAPGPYSCHVKLPVC